MSLATNDEVNAIFDEHQAKFPQLAEQIAELRTLFTTKMWHQLTDLLIKYVKDTAFDASQDGNELIVMYGKMIEKLNFKLNPIKYALITIACSRQHESIEDAIKFLEEAKGRLRNKHDAVFLLSISQAEKKHDLGLHHDCYEMLTDIKGQVEQQSDIDPKVYSALAHVHGLYYKRKDDHENYYKSCLQYLAYTPQGDLSEKEQRELSIKMGMSILLGKNVFNITELLDKDIINSLKGTDFEWLYFMMKTLGEGKITEFEDTVKQHNEYISKFPNIVQEMQYLEQKVRIVAFLEMIFNAGKDERSMSFQRIAQGCQVEEGDVELLVMKSMSLGLIRGTIDEVDHVVHIDWAMPRYLSKSHLQIMHKKMEEWELKMDNVIRLVENNSQELVQS
jgi:26S proteasome regulatory subunit N9